MEKEKIYNLKLTNEELELLKISILDSIISFRRNQNICRERNNHDMAERIEFDIKKCFKLMEHLNLILRYQGDENDRTN